MNCVQLVGRLVKDPDLRFTLNKGTPVARFTVAVRNRVKDEKDQYGAYFINCIAYNKTAENIANYLTKGREIAIVGSIATGSYKDKQGVKRYTTDVVISTFDFIGNKSNETPGITETPKNNYDDMTPVIDDGDIPF